MRCHVPPAARLTSEQGSETLIVPVWPTVPWAARLSGRHVDDAPAVTTDVTA